MSADTRTLIRRFYEDVICNGDFSRLSEMVSADYVDHNADPKCRGPDVVRRHLEGLRQTFPDFTLRIEDIVAEGDMVVTRVSGRGTHRGEWMGIEPSGTIVAVKGINIDRIADGLITEHWGEADTVCMLTQMGVDPFAGRRR